MYTFRRKREKEWSRLSKRVKDFYDRPLETRFIAAFRFVSLRFAKRRVGVPTRSRRLVRRPRFFVTEFLLADENTSFYVRERRKKKEATLDEIAYTFTLREFPRVESRGGVDDYSWHHE